MGGFLRDPPGGPLGSADPEPCEQRPDATVDLGPVLAAQDAGRLHHEQRVALGARPVGQRLHRAGHLVDQGAGQADEAVAEGGRLPAREGDLGPDRAHGVMRRRWLLGTGARHG